MKKGFDFSFGMRKVGDAMAAVISAQVTAQAQALKAKEADELAK